MPLLEIHNLEKSFLLPEGGRRRIIHVPEFALEAGEELAIQGGSGCGKTTFLNLVAGILGADSGTIRFDGTAMRELSEADRDAARAKGMGYIFQTFNLLQGFTCLENVLLGMVFGAGADTARAKALLERVGLEDRLNHLPRQLSTGQQQRVAVARALANRPKLVLADEPTGNLDETNAREALTLIRETCAENHAALMLVSHDPAVLGAFAKTRAFHEINKAGQS